MSPRQLADLDRGERRRAYGRLVVRMAAIATMLLIAYYTLPAGWLEGGTETGILRLVSSGLFFVLVLAWLVRRITKADLPQLRAIEVLAVILPLFLYIFANTYLAMSYASVDAFSEPLNHTGALYLAITLLSTVGFGDITPGTDSARIVVSVQMLLDLVLLGAIVRLVAKAARSGLSRD